MATSLSQLKDNIVPLPVKHNHHVVTFQIAIEELDANLLDALSEAEKSGNSEAMRLLISKVTKGWDLYDKEEGDFPPTVENIGPLPIPFITQAVKSIYELVNGNPQ